MKEGQTDFLDLMEPDDVSTTPEPTPEPAPAPQSEPSGQPRNPDGTYAKAEAEAAAQAQQGVKPEAQPAPGAEPPAADDGSPHVPRAALEAERKKRQALEAELAKLKPTAQSAPQSQTTAPKGPEFIAPPIDPEDPQSFAQVIHSMKMQQSQFIAVQQSSEQEVAEAWNAFDAACEADPNGPAALYSQTLLNHPHPIGEVVKWHRQQKELKLLQEAGGLEKLREKWLAEHLATAGAPATASAPASRPAPPAPPPSLASGGVGAAAEPETFDEKEEVRSFFEEARKPRKR